MTYLGVRINSTEVRKTNISTHTHTHTYILVSEYKKKTHE
jgi:hypothetical protein